MKFLAGLKNCHLPGLYSLVLANRYNDKLGMVRIFYAGPECRMDLWEGKDFRIKPHTHRQSVWLTPIWGDVKNVSLQFGAPIEHFVHRYRFTSALLREDFTLQQEGIEWCHLEILELPPQGISVHWSQVHTIIAQPGSAWLVQEGELSPNEQSYLYSKNSNLTLSSEGLYLPMSKEELAEMEELF